MVTLVRTTHGRIPPKGHQIYPRMLELDPDFFVHTGDIEYYDKPQPLGEQPDACPLQMEPALRTPYFLIFTQVGSYFMKDDHDTTSNDSWPGIDFVDLTGNRERIIR